MDGEATVKRRRVSFDIDEELYTNLKVLAIEKETKIYKLIEEAVSDMLQEKPKLVINDLLENLRNIDLSKCGSDNGCINPIVKACNEHKLSVNRLALLANVQVETVRRLMRGETKKISEHILAVLYQLGYDQSITNQYEQWRKNSI